MQRTSHTPVFVFSGFRLDPNRRLLLHNERPLSLHPKAFELLLILVENRGRVLSKSELLDKIWEGQFVEENNLAVQISGLRKILGESSTEHRFIVTVPGRGYRFVSDVRLDSAEITVDEASHENGFEAESETLEHIDRPSTLRHQPLYLYAFAIFVVLAGGAWYWLNATKSGSGEMKMTRLTTSGKVVNAALSLDEQFVVFAQKEGDGESLWLRQTDTGSQTRIIPTQPLEYVGLAISPDNHFIYFSTFGANQAATFLQRIPLLGGASERVGSIESGVSVTFSPDGRQFAFTEASSSARQSFLRIADSDGANKGTVLTTREDERMLEDHKAAPVAWSPDGSEIALSVIETNGSGRRTSGIMLVDPESGRHRFLVKPTFDSIHSLAWTSTQRLAFVGSDSSGYEKQVWIADRSTGDVKRITNDLQNYIWLAAGRRGRLLTIQKTETSNVRISDFNENAPALEAQEILNEPDIISVAFGPGEAIYYTSRMSGTREIWRAQPGGDSRQISAGADVISGFSISPRDGSFVFTSRRDGGNSVWISDADGKNLRRLTDESDYYPQFTPDGNNVIFQRGSHEIPTIWRVRVAGDTAPVQLTSQHSLYPTLSPDGSLLAFYFMDFKTDGQWRIGVVSAATGELVSKVSFDRAVSQRRMRWHPNGRYIGQIFNVGENANLMLIPIAGGEPQIISDLGKGTVNSFAWSADGRKIVYLLTTESYDAVSLADF